METIPIRHIKPTQAEPNIPNSFGIRDVRSLLDGKDMVQGLHRHDFFFILALKKAKGSHVIDFTAYEVADHTIFFMRPGQVHELSLKSGSVGYLMEFKNDFYYPTDKVSSHLLRSASSLNQRTLNAEGFKRLFVLLDSIFEEYCNRKDRYDEVIKANLSILFLELVRHRKQEVGASSKVSQYNQERLDAFLELLEVHIAAHKEVTQYADLLNLSTYQLNAITKTTIGKTCSEIINEYIILESRRYLLATSNQINEIAFHLGYEDVSYFIRFFKKHTGYTPEAFRNNFR